MIESKNLNKNSDKLIFSELLRKSVAYIIVCLFFTCLLISCSTSVHEVNIYSSRHYEIDDRIFEKFTEKTGIRVNTIKADADQLIRRIELEGQFSPADIIIIADAGRLALAGKNDLLQKIPENVWNDKLDKNLVDPDEKWIAFTIRTRVILFNKNLVDTTNLKNYEDLILPVFKNKILVRSAENVYNQSLLASILFYHGNEYATQWTQGIVKNMARTPRGNDTDQIKGINSGAGEIAIANSYYLAKLHNSQNPEDVKLAGQVGIIFPNQQTTGTHINFSGAGLVKNAPNKEHAIQFLEFLLSDEVQKMIMEENYEYPASKQVEITGFLKQWEPFKRDTLHLNTLAKLQQEANRILFENGWR